MIDNTAAAVCCSRKKQHKQTLPALFFNAGYANNNRTGAGSSAPTGSAGAGDASPVMAGGTGTAAVPADGARRAQPSAINNG